MMSRLHYDGNMLLLLLLLVVLVLVLLLLLLLLSSRVGAICAEVAFFIFDERLVRNHFIAVRAFETILVKLLGLDVDVLSSRSDWFPTGIHRTTFRELVGMAVDAVGGIGVDEELSLAEFCAAAAAKEALFVLRLILEADPAIRQRLLTLFALFGNVFFVAGVTVEFLLVVDETLGARNVRAAAGAIETAGVILRAFILR